MKFRYRFYSRLAPEEMAARIRERINLPFATRFMNLWSMPSRPPMREWKDLWKTLYQYANGNSFYGEVQGTSFALKRYKGKSMFPDVSMDGEIVPEKLGSRINLTLTIELQLAFWLFAICGGGLAFIMACIAQGKVYFPSQNQVGQALFFGTLFITIGGPIEFRYILKECKSFFLMIAGNSDVTPTSSSA